MSGARGKIHCYFGSLLPAESSSSRMERITFITSLTDKLSLSRNVSVKSTNLAVLLFPSSSSPIKTVPWGDHPVGGWPLVAPLWWTQYLKYLECPTQPVLLPSDWPQTFKWLISHFNYTKIVILIVIAKIGFQWADWGTDRHPVSLHC